MSWKILIPILAFLTSHKTSVLMQNDQLPFILLIDNTIPATNILNSYFSIYDNSGSPEDSIPFEYHVGYIEFNSIDYQNLIHKYVDARIFINFKYEKFGSNAYFTKNYKEELPKGGLNEQYMVIKIYNYIDTESRKKFSLKKNGYVFIIQSPNLESKSTKKE